MIFKNILRILISYRFSLIKIIFFELLYLIKGYKGNSFNFSSNDVMTDNIPCPYYFLYKIKKTIKEIDFEIFIDLGCGSGRVIDFFNKNLLNKKFIGIEYFDKQFFSSKANLEKYTNIQLINSDFTKIDFLKYNADCYFFNDPIKEDLIFINIINKISSLHNNRNILLIFVNCNDSIINSIKNIQCVETFYINDRKGYSIYNVPNK